MLQEIACQQNLDPPFFSNLNYLEGHQSSRRAVNHNMGDTY